MERASTADTRQGDVERASPKSAAAAGAANGAAAPPPLASVTTPRASLSRTSSPLPASPRPAARGATSLQTELRSCFTFEVPELFRDDPFTEADWRAHNSWKRHVCEPAVFTRVARSLAPLEAWVLLCTAAIGLYYELLQVPHGWPSLADAAYMPLFLLSSFAVSLVLVFRCDCRRRLGAGRACLCVYVHACMTLSRTRLPLLLRCCPGQQTATPGGGRRARRAAPCTTTPATSSAW